MVLGLILRGTLAGVSLLAKTRLGARATARLAPILRGLPFTPSRASRADVFLRAQVGRFFTKAPPRVATRAPVRGAPKLLKPVARIAGAPGRIARTVGVAAIGGAAFFAGEQFARKVFKPRAPRGIEEGGGVIPRGDGGVPPPVVAGAAAGGLLPTVGRIAIARGRVGKGVGIIGGLAGIARRGAVPALAGAGVVALGGGIVDSVTGQPIGFRRVKRSRIGFKRSDLKAFRRVISTAKRVKKILTSAGIGTFRSRARGPTHSELSSEHRRLK